jgi:hypothetical protein
VLQDDEEETQQHARDVEQLESALRVCAQELREAGAELERRSRLIRDVTVRWDALAIPAEAPSAVGAPSLLAERDAAIARALESEVAAMEARFRLDELAGHLAGVAAKPIDESAQLAARDGAIRGFRSRLAEAEDARDSAEARLMLTEHDLDDARAKAGAFRRESLEFAERLEVEALRARTDAGDLARTRGELLGLRHRADEGEQALQSGRDELTAARAMNEQLQKRVSVALAERDAARGAIELGRSERDLGLAEASRIREQMAALREELAERDADLATVRSSQSDTAPARDRAASLHAALVDARRGLHDLGVWLSADGHGAALAGTTSFELDAPYGVSDLPPRDDETLPGMPLDMRESASRRTPAVQALHDEIAARDAELQSLHAQVADLQRRSGLT